MKIELVSNTKESNNNELVSDKKFEESQNKNLSNSGIASELLLSAPVVEDLGAKQQLKTIAESSKNEESSDVEEESKIPAGLETASPTSITPEVIKMETQNYSTQELEIQKLIGEGPITKEKLNKGLLKLRNKGHLTFGERKIYVFLMKLLDEIIYSKK